MRVDISLPTYFKFTDGRKDNRCIIIGHTNTAKDVILLLRKNSKKPHKIYMSVCEMAVDEFKKWRRNTGYKIYATAQKEIIINGINCLACEFLEKEKTGFGFQATRSELNMYNSKFKKFRIKLNKSFRRV